LLRFGIPFAWMYRFGVIGSEAFAPRSIAMAIAVPNIRDQDFISVPHCGHDRGFVPPPVGVLPENIRYADFALPQSCQIINIQSV